MHNSMARRTSNKIEPASMTFYLPTGTIAPGASRTEYVDLSLIASLLNRRFYRQGLNWAVAGINVLSQAGFRGTVSTAKLPNTWVMANAWEKGMRTWLRMNNEAMSETESVRPRFMDYKIYADQDHQLAGFQNNLLPFSLGGVYTAGEWDPSKMVIPFGPSSPGNTLEVEIKAVGANYNGVSDPVVSLIEGYAASRGLPNIIDPNAPGDADDIDGSTPENWMQATFNQGVDQASEVVENNLVDNNRAPYPYENDGIHTDTMYPNGANNSPGLTIHSVDYISNTTIGGKTRIKGGNFPCGLIRLDIASDLESDNTYNVVLEIDLIPGNHRGYLAEPMTEM